MDKIDTISAEAAAERLRTLGMAISPAIVRDGLQQRVFPFGDCIVTETSRKCIVYTRLLEQWIAERSVIQD